MKEVLIALNQQPIAVYPIYIDITGSMTAGVLLSQVMYWDSKMKGNEFYKNDAEFMQETRLTQSEFKTAKKIIGDLPFITIQRKGVPCRTWYSVNHTNLLVVLQQFSSSFTYELGSRLSTSQRGVNLRTIIGTENTQKITTENTTIVETSSTVTLIDEVDETSVEIHHVPDYFEEGLEKTKLLLEKIEKDPNAFFNSKATEENPTPQVAPTPRPKAKRAKVENPTPIKAMWEIYELQYAKMCGSEKPEFMPKYLQPMKKLYNILEARQIQSGIVPLDKLQPWRDFIEMWGKYLQDHPKEAYFTANFNPATFYSQFNTIVAKLKNQPMTTEDKWEKFYRENTQAQ
jgi:hypothetical protein